MLDVAEECGVCEAVGRARKELGGVEGPLVLVVMVAEEERASGVRSGKDDYVRASRTCCPLLACRCGT